MPTKPKIRKNKKNFVAIDFETADRYRDSACAVALVRVESGKIVHKACHLIRPPRKRFEFTYIHGITWRKVAKKPDFGELWPEIEPILDGVGYLAAHNAAFDKSVLNACCSAADIKPPAIPFECTVALARSKWKIHPTKLPDVCEYLNIPLNHHEALSDAEACAKIAIAAANK